MRCCPTSAGILLLVCATLHVTQLSAELCLTIRGCIPALQVLIDNNSHKMRKSPLVVVMPAFYLMLGYLSLACFKVGYGLFTRLVQLHVNIPLWDTTVQPALQQILTLMQQSIGSADQLRFSMTNILLAAILIVLS